MFEGVRLLEAYIVLKIKTIFGNEPISDFAASLLRLLIAALPTLTPSQNGRGKVKGNFGRFANKACGVGNELMSDLPAAGPDGHPVGRSQLDGLPRGQVGEPVHLHMVG